MYVNDAGIYLRIFGLDRAVLLVLWRISESVSMLAGGKSSGLKYRLSIKSMTSYELLSKIISIIGKVFILVKNPLVPSKQDWTLDGFSKCTSNASSV